MRYLIPLKQLISQYTWLLVLLLLLLLFSPTVQAQEYTIDWYTIDSGGGMSSNDTYILRGTIGQADASPTALVSEDYALIGGYWHGAYFCYVDLELIARFGAHWLDTNCGTCGGADLDGDQNVTLTDLQLICDYWLLFCPAGWQL
jgi:hypothetical protein